MEARFLLSKVENIVPRVCFCSIFFNFLPRSSHCGLPLFVFSVVNNLSLLIVKLMFNLGW